MMTSIREWKKSSPSSHLLQKLCRYPWLFNTVVNKANKNRALHQTLIDALANPARKKWFLQPSFYYNLLFGNRAG